MIPQYDMFLLSPSVIGVDPEAPPVPRWLKLGLFAAVSFITIVAAALS